ncbi:MAG: hypothetical protein Q7S00_03635, partial [bacterium]|nr:hypothetical protein [bacterium]
MRKPNTIFSRVLGVLFLTVLIAALVGGFLSSRFLQDNAVGHLKESLLIAASLTESDAAIQLGHAAIPSAQDYVSELARKGHCRVTLIMGNGRVIGDSEQTANKVPLMENHKDRPEVREALLGIPSTSTRHSATLHEDMLYAATPVRQNGKITGVIRFAVPLTLVAELKSSVRLSVFLSILVGFCVALILGIFLTSRLTRSLRELSEVARSYTQGDFSRKPPVNDILEVSNFSTTLQTMAEAVQKNLLDLKTERNQVSAILENMTEGVVAIDS